MKLTLRRSPERGHASHSECDPSKTEGTSLLQIWIRPREYGLKPSYTEWHPKPEHHGAEKVLVISSNGRDDSATIHQDADIYRVRLAAGRSTTHEVAAGRGAWLQLIQGRMTINGVTLNPGDAASTDDPGTLTLAAGLVTYGAPAGHLGDDRIPLLISGHGGPAVPASVTVRVVARPPETLLQPTTLVRPTAGSVQVTSRVLRGQRYAFERSADLRVWTTLESRVAAVSEAALWTDLQPPAGEAHYRVRAVP